MTGIEPIAHIHTAFTSKFGIPRQSGLVNTTGTIVFCDKYRFDEALRGIEDYSHLWLIWGFSEAKTEKFNPTVRPPRLGGNKRMGVFATRSPFRPNSLGLSCVKLEGISKTAKYGTVLEVSGADMLNLTPIYDIKPYLSYTDSHPEAIGGFADEVIKQKLSVYYACDIPSCFDSANRQALTELLSQDPRPHYIEDEAREYAFEFLGCNIRFVCSANELKVTKINRLPEDNTK